MTLRSLKFLFSIRLKAGRLRLPRSTSKIWRLGMLAASPGLVWAASDRLETVEKAANEWVKTRAESARLGTEWAGERTLLELTVNGLKERARSLEDARDNLKAKTAEDRTEIEELTVKNRAAAVDLQAADVRLQAVTLQLRKLRSSLPPRLSDALEMSFRSLSATDKSLGERMQVALTVLNRCAQFNRLITLSEETVALEGVTKSVEVIYWGLSHGYALDRAAGKVWLGSPRAGQWQWTAQSGSAHEVADLIAIYQDKADPAFVVVPAHLAEQPNL